MSLVGICPTIAIWKWWYQGAVFLKGVGIDVLLMFLFGCVEGAITGVIGGFGGPDFSDLYNSGVLGVGVTLSFVLFCFWVLEARKPKPTE
jgi:hypothetical protein